MMNKIKESNIKLVQIFAKIIFLILEVKYILASEYYKSKVSRYYIFSNKDS